MLELLKAKANVNNAEEDGWTPLIVANHHGHTDVVSMLIKAGAQLGKAAYGGATALDFAVQGGHRKVTSVLSTAVIRNFVGV